MLPIVTATQPVTISNTYWHVQFGESNGVDLWLGVYVTLLPWWLSLSQAPQETH